MDLDLVFSDKPKQMVSTFIFIWYLTCLEIFIEVQFKKEVAASIYWKPLPPVDGRASIYWKNFHLLAAEYNCILPLTKHKFAHFY